MASQNQSKPQANFFAIIPANVLWHEGLEASAKLFYASINAMTDRDGYCWASNRYFAELFNVDESTIKRWLESLHSAQVIWIQTEKKGMGWSRKIYTVKEMFTKAQKCPIVKNILPPSENAPTGTFQRRLKNEPYEGSKMSPYIDKVIDKEITTPQPPAKKVGGSFKKEIDPEKKKLLEPLNLTDQEKRRLSKFDTKNIAHAIAYNKVVEPEKSLIAQLMWAAKMLPEIPAPKGDLTKENAQFSKETFKRFAIPKSISVNHLTDCVEIVYTQSQTPSKTFLFKEKCFKKELSKYLSSKFKTKE